MYRTKSVPLDTEYRWPHKRSPLSRECRPGHDDVPILTRWDLPKKRCEIDLAYQLDYCACQMPLSPLRAFHLETVYDQLNRQPSHQPWVYLDYDSAMGFGVVNSNARGFVQNQKLQPHKLQIIPMQNEQVYPKCMGRIRPSNDETLYPQYGDLKGAMFKRCRLADEGVLEKKRRDLVLDGGYLGREKHEYARLYGMAQRELETRGSVNEDLAKEVEQMRQQVDAAEEREKSLEKGDSVSCE